MSAPKPARALFTDFKVFSGSANRPLTEEICEALGCPVGNAMIRRFASCPVVPTAFVDSSACFRVSQNHGHLRAVRPRTA